MKQVRLYASAFLCLTTLAGCGPGQDSKIQEFGSNVGANGEPALPFRYTREGANIVRFSCPPKFDHEREDFALCTVDPKAGPNTIWQRRTAVPQATFEQAYYGGSGSLAQVKADATAAVARLQASVDGLKASPYSSNSRERAEVSLRAAQATLTGLVQRESALAEFYKEILDNKGIIVLTATKDITPEMGAQGMVSRERITYNPGNAAETFLPIVKVLVAAFAKVQAPAPVAQRPQVPAPTPAPQPRPTPRRSPNEDDLFYCLSACSDEYKACWRKTRDYFTCSAQEDRCRDQCHDRYGSGR